MADYSEKTLPFPTDVIIVQIRVTAHGEGAASPAFLFGVYMRKVLKLHQWSLRSDFVSCIILNAHSEATNDVARLYLASQ